jgi:unspecific peroxygenase
MTRFLAILALVFAIPTILSFPLYGSLAGLSTDELDRIIPTLQFRDSASDPPPGPMSDTSAKLVNDENHPWKPLRKGDIRGPCPGLNTLASHGVRV